MTMEWIGYVTQLLGRESCYHVADMFDIFENKESASVLATSPRWT